MIVIVGVSPFLHLPLFIEISLLVLAGVLTYLVDVLTVRLVIAGEWKGWFLGYQVGPAIRAMNAKVAITILAITLFTSLGFLAYECWQNYWWRTEVSVLSYYEGAERADHDFRAGKIRLFVIAGKRDDEIYSGTNDGPFQVWYPQYYPTPSFLRYSAEQMVEAYNSNMKIMQGCPAQADTPTNRQPNNAPKPMAAASSVSTNK